jgi:hypothetical protein
MANKDAEFSFLLEKIQRSNGNLSVQLKKMKEAKYIIIEKPLEIIIP